MRTKGLASYKLLESGWVLTVMHMKPADTITIFKADVVPSFRINDTLHYPRAAARDSGEHGKHQMSSQEVQEAMVYIAMLNVCILMKMRHKFTLNNITV